MVVIRRRRDSALLVASAVGDDFERLLGGHVEFGELAIETARREMREELGQELRDVRLLGVLENRFELDGLAGHEIVFVFEAAFAEDGAYEIEQQGILDDPTGLVRVYWRTPDDGPRRVVPDGVLELIG